MTKIYIVVEGGCVRYVSSTDPKISAVVIDLDDLDDAPDPQVEADLKVAEALTRIW